MSSQAFSQSFSNLSLDPVDRHPALERHASDRPLGSSHTPSRITSGCSTPAKTPQSCAVFLTPASKIPSAKASRSTGKRKTPSKGVRTPGSADRFIPSRVGTKLEAAHYK
ncbi:hypothetical protein EGW08_019594, partial [Elysia chlorotica]